MSQDELLHASDRMGRFVKTGPRKSLLAEMREHAMRHGDAPFAVPVVHVILLDSSSRIRLVQRGDKPENPHLWDKAVGGHVVWPEPVFSRVSYDDNMRKEMAEELGIECIRIAADPLEGRRLTREREVDLAEEALVWLADHDPWQGGVSRSREGPCWLKRQNVATYVGIYDGPFVFVDGEAVAERRLTREALQMELQDNPAPFADGVRLFLQRFFHLLRAR